MMKQIFFPLLFLISIDSSLAQTPRCNDSLIMSIKGTWKKYPMQPKPNEVTKTEFEQATKNIETFHQLFLEAYPEPIGGEPRWTRWVPHSIDYAPNVHTYMYSASLHDFFCLNNKLVKNSSSFITFWLSVNDFNACIKATNYNINGQTVYTRQLKADEWKGYAVYRSKEEPIIMLTRKNKLPFKPVTRKQYLDYMTHYLDSTYSDMINQMKGISDSSALVEMNTTKNNILKVYRNEMEKSKKANLLDSLAVVKVIDNVYFSEDNNIFISEEKGGTALLTLNPSYFLKDLPKYVPQFFVINISSMGANAPAINFLKMIKEKFPFEKLQAMIR